MDGITVHADVASVNLNFWVTPDDANLDPSSGGLVVYPKEPPHGGGATDGSAGESKVLYVGLQTKTHLADGQRLVSRRRCNTRHTVDACNDKRVSLFG